MTILYPWMLLLLPLILLPWRNRKSTVSFPSLGIVQSSKTWRIRFIWVPPLLASFGLIFLIFASSRPIEEKVKQIQVQEGLDIVLVVDTSGSMQENDYSWNGQRISRMGVARETIKEFVSQRPYDRIGLVVFGEEACTQAPLTMNQKGLLPFVEQIKIGVVGESSTAIGDGIAIAAQRLKSLEAPSKLMIVLTDGRSNTGADPILMAKASAELGITIYTIGIGGGRVGLMGMMGLTSSIDGDSLSEIARITGGKSFVAQTGETLKKVYEEIDTLEPSPAEFEEYTQRKEYFSYFAWCGLILLLLEWSLSQTLFRRLP